MIGTKKEKYCQQYKNAKETWDHKKFNPRIDTNEEMIKELLYIAQNSPSKQHEGYYDVYWTADRNTIQEISRYTWGQYS